MRQKKTPAGGRRRGLDSNVAIFPLRRPGLYPHDDDYAHDEERKQDDDVGDAVRGDHMKALVPGKKTRTTILPFWYLKTTGFVKKKFSIHVSDIAI